jgi:Protein of unknown function (DUF2892)
MTPNLSAWIRATRMLIGAIVLGAGPALWPDASDLCGLLGVTTFVTGVVGWCPLHERFSTHRQS